ncbi:hypothetical protein ACFV0W_23355, partial [Streptomyces anulatus]
MRFASRFLIFPGRSPAWQRDQRQCLARVRQYGPDGRAQRHDGEQRDRTCRATSGLVSRGMQAVWGVVEMVNEDPKEYPP